LYFPNGSQDNYLLDIVNYLFDNGNYSESEGSSL
jgi:hypothetical protein